MVLIFAHRINTKKTGKNSLTGTPPSVIPGCLKGDDQGSLEDCDKERPKTNIKITIFNVDQSCHINVSHGHLL